MAPKIETDIWKSEYPKEFGVYWYHSFISGKTELVQIRHRYVGSGFQAVTIGGCAWAPEDGNGLWAKAIPPQ
jgi:hypothetical protein